MAVELEGRRARLLEVLGRSDDVSAVLRGVLVAGGRGRAPGRSRWRTSWRRCPPTRCRRTRPAPTCVTGSRSPSTHRTRATSTTRISVEREQGGLRVFVHIADVSAFVVAGGSIDEEASWRGCSVYLPGRVEPMLPHALSSNVCSLQPGVDRYAVTIEVAPDGTATAYRSADPQRPPAQLPAGGADAGRARAGRRRPARGAAGRARPVQPAARRALRARCRAHRLPRGRVQLRGRPGG